MSKSAKRFLSLFLAVLMVAVMFVVPARAIPTTTGEIISYNQEYWKDTHNKGHLYDLEGTPEVETIASSGCALVAFTNAVKYLNGNYIDPCGLAAYALTHKRPGKDETYRIYGGTDKVNPLVKTNFRQFLSWIAGEGH